MHLTSRKPIPAGADISADEGKGTANVKPSKLEGKVLAELLEKCRSGDRSAQQRLYDALSGKMFALCLRYMGNRESAQDILQDGFITLFTKIGSFTGEGSFEGWARKIFVNTALMSLRKNDILKASDPLENAYDLRTEIPSQMQNIGYKELLDMISSLPPGYRTVFNMAVIEGYSHREIASELGISEATSRSQLQRARMMLQDKIREL